MKTRPLLFKNGIRFLKRCLPVLLMVCILMQSIPAGGFAENRPGIRLEPAVEEIMSLFDSLPTRPESKKNDIIGYDYYNTLPGYWEGVQRSLDFLGLKITDALTNMNRRHYYFTMALIMCSRADPIEWTNTEALQRLLGENGDSYNIDELIGFLQMFLDEDSPVFPKDQLENALEYAKGLKALRYSVKGIEAFCDIVNECALLNNLDWEQAEFLAEAWQEHGGRELKEVASVLKAMKDAFSDSVESCLLVRQIIFENSLDVITEALIDSTLNAAAQTAFFVYKATLLGVDVFTRFTVLTGSFNDMKFAAEALIACKEGLTGKGHPFFLDEEYYLETDAARERLRVDLIPLAYMAVNYAESCAIMEESYVNYIELGKASMTGMLYINDTLIDRAERSRNHAVSFREKADRIRNRLQLIDLLIDHGGLLPDDWELYEAYKKDWAHRWAMKDQPDIYLDITFDWDYATNVTFHFKGIEGIVFPLTIYTDVKDTGYFGDPSEGLNATLWVNSPRKGEMTVMLGYTGDIGPDSPLFPYLSYRDDNGTLCKNSQTFVIEDSPDGSFSPEADQEYTFSRDGLDCSFKWGPGLFNEDAHSYSNDLALAAGVLSWAAEDTKADRISRLFRELGIVDEKDCCYDFERDRSRALRYKLWDSEKDEAAFVIGRKVLSLNGEEDTTLLIVVGRGTQPWHLREIFGADWLRTGDGPEEVAGEKVFRSISSFGEAMWQSLDEYMTAFPAETPRIKILVTGHSLGGAMANCLGARITKEADRIPWLKDKASAEDIYVYTFGALKVLTGEDNVSEGFENIHNIYHVHDTYGSNGGMGALNVSSPGMKFGHTDLYRMKDETEGFLETKNHDMSNTITAITEGLVHCPSSYSSPAGVFDLLSKRILISADSSGDCCGELSVHADGSFSGRCYDDDITGLFYSSFSGSFRPEAECLGNTVCCLTIQDITVRNIPFTAGSTADGRAFEHTLAPFSAGDRLLLTLPGTSDEEIPFIVRCEIGWLYGQYRDYGNYYTLSAEESGWGFFADETNPETEGRMSLSFPGP